MLVEIVTPAPAANAVCLLLNVDQSVLVKYPFALDVAAGIDIVFIDLVNGDEKVKGASKSEVLLFAAVPKVL